MKPALPGRDGQTAYAICVLGIVVVALFSWSHVRWHESSARNLILIDSLNQSRHAARNAELIAERALAENAKLNAGVVIAELHRARSFVDVLLQGDARLGDMQMRRPPPPALRDALSAYGRVLGGTETLITERLSRSGATYQSDLRAASVQIDAAALHVERELLDQIRAEHTRQHVIDVCTLLIAAAMSLGSLLLLIRSQRRNETAYARLAEGASRLRAIAGAIPGAIYVLDREGRYVEAFGQQAGQDTPGADQLIGRTLSDVMPLAVSTRQLELIREALSTDGMRTIEYARTLTGSKDLRPRRFEGRLNPLGDGEHVVWVTWDVSERWQATQRVAELKRLYELLSSVNQAIVWSHDQATLLDTICRTASTVGGFQLAWVSWHDATSGELHTVASFGQPDLRAALERGDGAVAGSVRETFARGEMHLLNGAAVHTVECPVSGEAGPAYAYAGIPLRDGGRMVGVLSLLDRRAEASDDEEAALLGELGVDISHAITQFSREARQRENEARMQLFAAALESCQDGVVVTDTEGRIVTTNSAFTRITGYSAEEAVGQNPGFLRSGRHDKAFYAAMWQRIKQTGSWQGEIWNRRKNGEVYAQWMSISTVHHSEKDADHYVSVFTDISHLKDTEERLKHLAHYDVLTGLPNRTLLNSRLEHALEVARRQQVYLAVLFIDLDNFKHVNDALGHNVGDELLVAVTQRIASRLRKQDTLGRLGGDEFLLVLESLQTPQDAAVVATSLLAALDEPITLPSGHSLYIQVSIGVAIFPDDADSAAELIRQADSAMYQAKRAGRSTYRYYTEELTAAASYRLELEARLRRAFENDEFSLNFQPQVSLATGEVTGAEVLVRLNPPGQQAISPAIFIPLLEETGLIVQLGEWVLRKTCEQGQAWLSAGYDFGTLAINASSHEIRRGDFVERLQRALDDSGLPPRRLEIELTESGMMEQGEYSEQFLRGVSALGIHLSIDDFGTGYSSLSYLRKLPVDKLKIDRSFISEIPTNEADAKLTATIIAISRNLGIKVLAEGVESEAQLDFLREQGCDAWQGYLLSPPLNAEAYAERFLRK